MTQSDDTEPDHEIQSDHETESDRDTDSVTCFQDFWGGFSNFCFYKKLDVVNIYVMCARRLDLCPWYPAWEG